MGRKTKLTPDKHETLLNYIRAGTPKEIAAQAIGITRTTFYRWMHNGNGFSDSIKKAESEAINLYVLRIQKAGEHSWQANAWVLERRYPELFAKKEIVKVEGTEKITFAQFRMMFKNEDIKKDVRNLQSNGVIVTPKTVQLSTDDNK